MSAGANATTVRLAALAAVVPLLLPESAATQGSAGMAEPESALAAPAALRAPHRLRLHCADPRAELTEERKCRVSYGGSVGLAYAIPITLTLTSVSAATATRDASWLIPMAVSVPATALAPPIVHWSYGHFWRGTASLGMNIGLMMLPGVLVSAGCAGESDSASDPGLGCAGTLFAIYGGATGILQGFWGIIDATALAYDDGPSATPISLPVFPSVVVEHGRATLSIHGVF